MNLILNNPYRILGLLVGVTTREQTKQVSRLRQYIEAEQKPESDYSFEIIGEFDRTISNVDKANSQLNLNDDKMLAALLWFWNGKPITDDVAIEALKDGDIDKAYQIWDSLITEVKEDGKKKWKEVTEKNFSAFHNYAVLGLVIKNLSFVSSVVANLKFIDSDFFDRFVKVVTDDTYNLSKKEIQLFFLNNIFEQIDKKNSIELVKYLNGFNFSAKTDYLKGFIQTPIENIERKIIEIENKSKNNKAKAGDYGNELYSSTKEDFELIISILPNSDIKVINIADKLSEALLDCSIAVFNHFQGTETEVGEISLDLNYKAKSIARSSGVIARIDKNTSIMQDNVNYRAANNVQKYIDSRAKKSTSKLDEIVGTENQSFLKILANLIFSILIGILSLALENIRITLLILIILAVYLSEITSSKKNELTPPNLPQVEETTSTETTNDYTAPIESKYKGNQLKDGASPLTNCFGKGIYSGNATLTIENGGNSDAIICLYSIDNDRTIRNEYVKKNSSFTMSKIAQGDYKIRVFYGNDWNPNLENSCGTKGNFESDVNFMEFDNTNYFQDSDGQYTTATITLYAVEGGNAHSSVLNQADFFKK